MADQPPIPTTEDEDTSYVGLKGSELGLHQSWFNLMTRLGVYGPSMVAKAAGHLDAVDRITGIPTTRKP